LTKPLTLAGTVIVAKAVHGDIAKERTVREASAEEALILFGFITMLAIWVGWTLEKSGKVDSGGYSGLARGDTFKKP
jgi:hypothetical protein